MQVIPVEQDMLVDLTLSMHVCFGPLETKTWKQNVFVKKDAMLDFALLGHVCLGPLVKTCCYWNP